MKNWKQFFKKKIFFANERVKLFQIKKNELTKRLRKTNANQIKYYNKKHTSQKYFVNQLIMFFIKNLKQKRFNKKLSHKFVKSFKIENKMKKQIYRFTFFFIYRIHNIFHVFFWNFIIIELILKKRMFLCKFSNE